jgi:hypothetical protein
MEMVALVFCGKRAKEMSTSQDVLAQTSGMSEHFSRSACCSLGKCRGKWYWISEREL